jgi:hypothetical protein
VNRLLVRAIGGLAVLVAVGAAGADDTTGANVGRDVIPPQLQAKVCAAAVVALLTK